MTPKASCVACHDKKIYSAENFERDTEGFLCRWAMFRVSENIRNFEKKYDIQLFK